MAAPERIRDLVKYAEEDFDDIKTWAYAKRYLTSTYILPMFKALGWDVNTFRDRDFEKTFNYRLRKIKNRIFWRLTKDIRYAGSPYVWKEVGYWAENVIHSDRPTPYLDFQVGDRIVMVLWVLDEALTIKDNYRLLKAVKDHDGDHYFRIVVVTNAREMAVYASKMLPNHDWRFDELLYLTYKGYVHRWDEIYDLISKPALFEQWTDHGRVWVEHWIQEKKRLRENYATKEEG